MSSRRSSLYDAALCLFLFAFPLGALASPAPKTVPITTASEVARGHYLAGRDALEKLRATDACALFEKAVAADPNFALAYLGLANCALTTQSFFAALKSAVAFAGNVSEGERLMVLGFQAGVNGDLDGQKRMYLELVAQFPADERTLTLLGNTFFATQEFASAIQYLSRATKIAPSFSPPYNQLGYAYRLAGNYPEAEKCFKKYIELLPNDPNPHDSYGELLMKMGRFDESIASYRKALKADPTFTPSLIGIANDQMFEGKGEAARQTLQHFTAIARNDGERRQALFWTAQSYVLEGRYDDALRTAGEELAIAQKSGDLAAQSQDMAYMGNILLHAGRVDAAATRFDEAQALMATASVPAEVKEANRRNGLFNTARVTLKRGDLKTARAQASDYLAQTQAKRIPAELWQAHELLGMVAIAEADYVAALSELANSTDQNPRVLYLTAVALQGRGEHQRATATAQAAANFNAPNALFCFVRPAAQKLVAAASPKARGA